MSKLVLILGASRYYIHLIKSCIDYGYEVLATDKDPNAEGFQYATYHEPIDITDIKATLLIAKKYKIDGIIAINDFGVKTAAIVAKEMNLVGLSTRVAEYVTNKAWMRKIWKNAGVSSVRFKVVESLSQAMTAVKEMNFWPLILKPVDSRGGGSRGVSKINDITELQGALEFAQEFYEDKRVIIEEFLNGSEHTIEALTFNGKTYVIAIADNIKTSPPYRVNKSIIYPTALSETNILKLKKVVCDAVAAIGIDKGAAHIELCLTDKGPVLFEIGARCGGGGIPDPIVPFVTGIDMFREVVRISVGEKPKINLPKNKNCCVYRFLTPREGKIKSVSGIEEVSKWPNILDCGLLVEAGDTIKKVRVGGDRAGFIIAGGDNREEAIKLADQAEKKIQIQYITGKREN